MGTKNNPGAFDCYAHAHPDEPMFVLLGRDRHAPILVRLWALLRYRDGESSDKTDEALACVDAMEEWAAGLGKQAMRYDDDGVRERLELAATQGLDDHPEFRGKLWDGVCDCDTCRSYD